MNALERNAGVVGPCRLCDGRRSIEHYTLEFYEDWDKPSEAAEWRAKLEELTGDGAAEKSSEADD